MNEEDLYRAVGKAIAVRRDQLDLTQSEVAQRVGLSRASLANIETGRQKILLHYLYRIAAVLDLDRVDALLPAYSNSVTKIVPADLKIGGDALSDKQMKEVTAFYVSAKPKSRSARAKS